MKYTNEMVNRLKEVAEELYFDYEMIGIRVQDVPFELGEINHLSHVWDDGEDTGEELCGICVIDYKEIESLVERQRKGFCGGYPGTHVAIIAGNYGMSGEDFGELIIEDAEVIEILA